MKKEDRYEKGDINYDGNNERNEKGDCNDNSETLRRSRSKKGEKKGYEKGDSIQNYVKREIVDDEFEAKDVKFFKDRWWCALTREAQLDTLLLQVHLRIKSMNGSAAK